LNTEYNTYCDIQGQSCADDKGDDPLSACKNSARHLVRLFSVIAATSFIRMIVIAGWREPMTPQEGKVCAFGVENQFTDSGASAKGIVPANRNKWYNTAHG